MHAQRERELARLVSIIVGHATGLCLNPLKRRFISLEKNPITDEVGVRGFLRSTGDFLLLMNTVKRSYSHRLSYF
jgi:hypothetical protein